MVIVFFIFRNSDTTYQSESSALLRIFVPLIFSIAGLIAVCIVTGEKPQWQWGVKEGLHKVTREGVGVMIWKDGKVLLGKRKNAHGSDEYSFPGGHLEYMESFTDAIGRETMEETGMTIGNIQYVHTANINIDDLRHYINICFTSDWVHGEPRTREPEKCEAWNWYDMDHLPKPLFFQTALLVNSFKKNVQFYDQKDLPRL
ncbi:MAG: NUDIX domain-containing protein [Candidatus Pacebacteria bacterium]|nr:NUDIX domain-containing protein [Candidatus Paceibacterota bacterium]